jgi:hypothetical protein
MRRAFSNNRFKRIRSLGISEVGLASVALSRLLEREGRLGDEGHGLRSDQGGGRPQDPSDEMGPPAPERCLAGRAERGVGRDR